MLQNPRKILGFKKNMVYKIPPGEGGGEVNHIQPVAYLDCIKFHSNSLTVFLQNGHQIVLMFKGE